MGEREPVFKGGTTGALTGEDGTSVLVVCGGTALGDAPEVVVTLVGDGVVTVL